MIQVHGESFRERGIGQYGGRFYRVDPFMDADGVQSAVPVVGMGRGFGRGQTEEFPVDVADAVDIDAGDLGSGFLFEFFLVAVDVECVFFRAEVVLSSREVEGKDSSENVGRFHVEEGVFDSPGVGDGFCIVGDTEVRRVEVGPCVVSGDDSGNRSVFRSFDDIGQDFVPVAFFRQEARDDMTGTQEASQRQGGIQGVAAPFPRHDVERDGLARDDGDFLRSQDAVRIDEPGTRIEQFSRSIDEWLDLRLLFLRKERSRGLCICSPGDCHEGNRAEKNQNGTEDFHNSGLCGKWNERSRIKPGDIVKRERK